MANQKHLAILMDSLEKEDIGIWNTWRDENPNIRPDLNDVKLDNENLVRANLSRANFHKAVLYECDFRKADLSNSNLREVHFIGVNLSEANLSNADLFGAVLPGANLIRSNLKGAYLDETNLSEAYMARADLFKANLKEANLNAADLTGANLQEANLLLANLNRANLDGANLNRANLQESSLIETSLINATIEGCSIYGISAWDVKMNGAIQRDLNISMAEESPITVDNLKIAQFIYLLLNNAEIRDVIDTVTAKAVLILGRFTPERKIVLDSIRDELRKRDLLPILFDFEKPSQRDLTETVTTLAHLSRFIIVDITDAKSIPQELQAIVPNLPSVAIQPIIQSNSDEYAMFESFKRYPWVLPVHQYTSQETLIEELAEKVIQPALNKAEEIRPKPFG